jgi:hypothetical protein
MLTSAANLRINNYDCADNGYAVVDPHLAEPGSELCPADL